MLEIAGLRKRFGVVEVLRDVSLAVSPGEVVVVIGPSGSGKTTLLRCINLLEEYERGSITIDGEPIGYRIGGRTGKRLRMSEREIAAARQRIGMVFQSYNLFPHMNVLQNIVAAPVRVKGIERRQAEARARELLAMVGLSDKLAEYPIRLSGGQQQRVAIARQRARRPARHPGAGRHGRRRRARFPQPPNGSHGARGALPVKLLLADAVTGLRSVRAREFLRGDRGACPARRRKRAHWRQPRAARLEGLS
jgi:ABC-type lipoprotein export system ATPase subunit